MFSINKYTPKSIDEIINENNLHMEEAKKILNISKDNSIPHLIFYGPEGSGKKTLIRVLLKLLYGKSVEKIIDVTYSVSSSGNTSKEVSIKQSPYHIIIEPQNNNFDRYLIQDIVKKYAEKNQLTIENNKKMFKVVMINNIDNLSYHAQTSLRRTMEIYSKSCRFIMWSRSLSKVIDPLISRCFSFQVKSPTNSSLYKHLLKVSLLEKIPMEYEDYNLIIYKCNGNIKEALWMLELKKYGLDCNTSYDLTIKLIAKYLKKSSYEKLVPIRLMCYDMIITSISCTAIAKSVLNELLDDESISHDKKIKIIRIAANVDPKLIKGRRKITQLEKFFVKIMNILI